MPSILTHQYVAELFIARYQKAFPFLKKHSSLVWLGAQGPDPFFFYGRAPLKKRLEKDTINYFGSTLHNQAPHKSLWPLLEQGWFKAQTDEARKAYILGALTHYVLDRTCHPYVFFRSGFDEHGSLTGHYSADHARLEVEIDVALTNKLKLDATTYQPLQTLNVDPISLQSISQLYFSSFPKSVQATSFQQAVEDMKLTYKWLYHGRILKRLFFTMIAGKRSLAVSLMHPRTLPRAIALQALNLNRKSWRDPVTGATSQKSILQLIEIALEELGTIIDLITSSQLTETKFKQWCRSLDYDGKEVGKTMRYFQSYYSSYRGLANHDQLISQSKKKSV
jgi:hypothetical protein